MPTLYWNPLSVSYLIINILVAAIASYIIYRLVKGGRSSSNFKTNLFLSVAFGAAMFGTAAQVLSIVLEPVPANYVLPWVGPFGAVATSSVVLFTFHFHRAVPHKKLSEILLVALLIALFIFEIYIAVERVLLLQNSVVEYRSHWSPIPHTSVFLLAVFFLFRNFSHAYRVDTALRDLSPRNPIVALFFDTNQLGEKPSAIRAFLVAILMPMGVFVISLVQALGFIDWTSAFVIIIWFYLLTIGSLAMAYLNYVPAQSSLRTRIAGASLTGVLIVLTGVSWLVGTVYLENYEPTQEMKPGTTWIFSPVAEDAYSFDVVEFQFADEIGTILEDTSVPIQLPFDFSFYGERYSEFYASNTGAIGFHSPPRVRDLLFDLGPQPAISLLGVNLIAPSAGEPDNEHSTSGIFVNQTAEALVVTWNRLSSTGSADQLYTMQLELHSDGRIAFNFIQAPKEPVTDLLNLNVNSPIAAIIPPTSSRTQKTLYISKDYPISGSNFQALVNDKNTEFLTYLDQIFGPLAWFTLWASVAVLLVFPWFYTINFNRSTQDLLRGVREILAGNLKNRIRVQYRDEIGFLATSFNEMAAAQDELIDGLEQKVRDRTKEVEEFATRNATLEERNRLFHELHDAVSQTLFSANLVADDLPKTLAQDTGRAQIAVKTIKRLNSDAMSEMRDLLRELKEQSHGSTSFAEAATKLIDGFRDEFQGQILVSIQDDHDLTASVRHTFFRVLQECIANIAKHAKAKNIEISFSSDTKSAQLEVKDDGIGFDSEAPMQDSFGLLIMKERMKKIDGQLSVRSETSAGTSIVATVD